MIFDPVPNFNLSFFTNSAYSELYIYPDSRNPIFYVDFPNAWNTMAEDELIYSSLDNDSVFIFLWSIDAKDTSEAVTSVEGILSSIFDALEIQRHNDVFINDILFKNFASHLSNASQDRKLVFTTGNI